MIITKEILQSAVDKVTPELLDHMQTIAVQLHALMDDEEFSSIVDQLGSVYDTYGETAMGLALYHRILLELEK